MAIGVLAFQGSFEAHRKALTQVGASVELIKQPSQLQKVEALIIPGGESTTMLGFLKNYDFFPSLQSFYQERKPIFGTCAGLILMAKKVISPNQESLGFLDITVERNGYGRQKESFETTIQIPILGKTNFPAIFIRAPRILKWGEEVEVLANWQGEPIFIRQKNCLAATFHPELTLDYQIHEFFIHLCKGVPKGV